MNINDAFPSRFLKASDLAGRAFTLEISKVDFEDLNGERKVVLHFKGAEKGMVLNKTNAYTISAIYGPETDGWIGKPVEVFTAMVNFQGQQTPALRVKAVSQPAAGNSYAEAAQPNPYEEAKKWEAPQQQEFEDDMSDTIPF